MTTAESLECRLLVDGGEKVVRTVRLLESGRLDVRLLLQALGVEPSTLLSGEPFRRVVRRLATQYSCPPEEIVWCALVNGGL